MALFLIITRDAMYHQVLEVGIEVTIVSRCHRQPMTFEAICFPGKKCSFVFSHLETQLQLQLDTDCNEVQPVSA